MWNPIYTLGSLLLLAGLAELQTQEPVPLVAPDQQAAPAAAPQLFPPLELVDFQQSSADSLDSLFGQALLLEFFAYW